VKTRERRCQQVIVSTEMKGDICPAEEHNNLCTFTGIVGRVERRRASYMDVKI
jgi:hypothetical protein